MMRRMREQGAIYRLIAEQFGVTISCVHMVCKRKSWVRV